MNEHFTHGFMQKFAGNFGIPLKANTALGVMPKVRSGLGTLNMNKAKVNTSVASRHVPPPLPVASPKQTSRGAGPATNL